MHKYICTKQKIKKKFQDKGKAAKLENPKKIIMFLFWLLKSNVQLTFLIFQSVAVFPLDNNKNALTRKCKKKQQKFFDYYTQALKE